MAYSFDFIKLGEQFKTDCCFGMTKDRKYRVYLKDVYYRKPEDKATKLHQPISGVGFTFEDACADFYRQARGGLLYHETTEQIEAVI
jgi:hypothetical protein